MEYTSFVNLQMFNELLWKCIYFSKWLINKRKFIYNSVLSNECSWYTGVKGDAVC